MTKEDYSCYIMLHQLILTVALFCFRYNNKTYSVDDIDWDKRVTDTFDKSNGSKVSYRDYYKAVSALGFISTIPENVPHLPEVAR